MYIKDKNVNMFHIGKNLNASVLSNRRKLMHNTRTSCTKKISATC
jgi:hypothetical protein